MAADFTILAIKARTDFSTCGEFELKSGKEKQVTNNADDPAVTPAIAQDGSLIVYLREFELERVEPGAEGKAGRPKLTRFYASRDGQTNRITRRTLTKASNLSFSKDGLEAAFETGGDIWIMDTVLKEPRQITNTPYKESEPVMAPDGKAVYFIRNTGVKSDIYFSERVDEKRYWWQNREFKETQVTKDGDNKGDLNFVPGGDRISYIRGLGDLWISNRDGKQAKRIVEAWSPPHYSWSPDAKWIAYAVNDADFNRDVWIAPLDGKLEPFNVSRHPDYDGSPTWSPNGKILAFTGRRFEDETDVYYVYLSKSDEEEGKRDRTIKSAIEKMKKERKTSSPPATAAEPKPSEPKPATPPPAKPKEGEPAPASDPPKEKEEPEKKPAAPVKKPAPKLPEVKIDFDGMYERIRRISIKNSSESGLFWAHDSKRLAFRSEIKGAKGTYYVSFPDKLTPSLLNSKQGSFTHWIPKNDTLFWLVDGVPASLSKGSLKTYSFRAQQEFDREAYWGVGFDHIWSTMGRIWYDENLNHKDWDGLREKYREAAAKAVDHRAFDRVASMLLGELNGSHLGYRSSVASSYRAPTSWLEETPHLGVKFDEKFAGPGLKVSEVVPKGPADQIDSRLKQGDIILEIDDVKVSAEVDLTRVLNGIVSRDVRLKIKGKDEEMGIRPISYSQIRGLMQSDQIDRNRKMVDQVEQRATWVCLRTGHGVERVH